MSYVRVLVLVLMLVLWVSLTLQAQQTGAYDYPLRPGTAEWKSLVSHDDMLKACQIPEATLRLLSTTDLIASCLAYPLYQDMFTYDFIQEGFERVSGQFNGLHQLIARRDAAALLLEEYSAMNPGGINESATLREKGQFLVKFSSIEILLSQSVLLRSLNKEQRLTLLRDCLGKARIKLGHRDVYGDFSLGTLALLTGRILQCENSGRFQAMISHDKKLETFLQKSPVPNSSLVRVIFDSAAEYVAQN